MIRVKISKSAKKSNFKKIKGGFGTFTHVRNLREQGKIPYFSFSGRTNTFKELQRSMILLKSILISVLDEFLDPFVRLVKLKSIYFK